ncbi:MAG: response regulator transcription factor [Chloroherpetonaceae bacterium]
MKYTEEKNKASPFAPASLSATKSVESTLEVAKKLSERERRILEEIVKGCTVEHIAKRLFISSHPVHHHLRKHYDKMHVHSRSQAVAPALKQGLS